VLPARLRCCLLAAGVLAATVAATVVAAGEVAAATAAAAAEHRWATGAWFAAAGRAAGPGESPPLPATHTRPRALHGPCGRRRRSCLFERRAAGTRRDCFVPTPARSRPSRSRHAAPRPPSLTFAPPPPHARPCHAGLERAQGRGGAARPRRCSASAGGDAGHRWCCPRRPSRCCAAVGGRAGPDAPVGSRTRLSGVPGRGVRRRASGRLRGLGAAARHRVRHHWCRGEARAPDRGWRWRWAALRPPHTALLTLTCMHR